MSSSNRRGGLDPRRIDSGRASSTIGRNTLWNLLGTGLPIILALATVPVIINLAGAARFGVLTIAWAVLGYFGLFDLGVGRAIIRFLAEAFEHRRVAESRGIFWTSVILSCVFGTVGAGLLSVLTPWLVSAALNVPEGLQAESRGAFYIVAVGVPLTTLTAALRGTLEAKHRFGLVNIIQVPNAILLQAAPLLVLLFSQDLRWLIGAMVLSRGIGASFFFVATLRNLEGPFQGPIHWRKNIRLLFSYSSWQAVTNSISPLMVNADRFVIGSISSMTAVAYYATPAEVVNRLLIIPQSLSRTTFPIFSVRTKRQQRTRVYVNVVRYLTLVVAPLVATLIVFAPDLLELWVGPTFSQNSTLVMQILAVGLLLNSLAIPSFGLIQATGRPDVTAKFHLLELPPYILILWYSVQVWGIVGAAAAWTLRVGVDFLLLTAYVRATDLLGDRAPAREWIQRLLAFSLLLLIASWAVQDLVVVFFWKLCVWSLLSSMALYLVWRWMLTTFEKERAIRYVMNASTLFGRRPAVREKD